MNSISDKKDWHRKVYNDTIIENWREEAMEIPDQILMATAATPSSAWYGASIADEDSDPVDRPPMVKGIMSRTAFEYCIQELQSKALYFEQTGLIPTLDASATIIKSDVLVDSELQEALKQAFKTLKDDQADQPDWHPRSNDMVQDLVHPSMYPLIYGQSRVLDDEVVGLAGAISQWAGKGEIIPKESTPAPKEHGLFGPRSEFPDFYWSTTYQWLPANVAFRADGGVKFTSYINNLHPNKYPEIYSTVEDLIKKALPAWEHCLIETKAHRKCGPGRIGSRFPVPHNADETNMSNWIPSNWEETANVEIDLSHMSTFRSVEDEKEEKWRLLRTPVLREPDSFVEVNYDPSKTPNTLDVGLPGQPKNPAPMRVLSDKFKASGLQIIVKMASIELTPEKPEFPEGGWHVEGLLNERICATALYYLDSENVTDSSLSFRMQTWSEQSEFQEHVSQDDYHWLECCYGTKLSSGSCLQNYGSVETREGRLLAFPNVFQHRVSSFNLADPTRPGHRRFIALWLVDPHRRILSTANVPPQQRDWWAESVFGKPEDNRTSATSHLPAEMVQLLREKGVAVPEIGSMASLPPELLDIVRAGFDLPTLSSEEAKEHRLRLMEERTVGHEEALSYRQQSTYSFCEH
ncbi:hypothetical protein Daus18300_004408 [Diaporthe australafricana]|uniref:Uncharacterized protein n=1 Tax=Diaporthe australafricana TaxID=127596 RepID=A0ABR3X8N5_9PEZI